MSKKYTVRICYDVKGYDEILVPLTAKLQQRGLPVDFRLADSSDQENYRTEEEMRNWYNSGTVYVVAGKREGTPNPALESASCGCVIVSTAVGNMPELISNRVNGEIVERNVDAMCDAIVRCQGRYVEMAEAMRTAIEPWYWKTRAGQYFRLFRQLIDRRRRLI